MDIRWLGYCTFEIRSGASVVIFDPYPGCPAPRLSPESALVVAISHDDRSHVDGDGWESHGQVLAGPGEYEIRGLAFKGVPTQRSLTGGGRAINTVYALETERITVCHLGFLTSPLSAQARQQLAHIDVLFAPAPDGGTLDAEGTASAIRQLEPKLVVPMYYGGAGEGDGASRVDRLISEIGIAAGETQPRLSVSRSNLPSETRVARLRPAD